MGGGGACVHWGLAARVGREAQVMRVPTPPDPARLPFALRHLSQDPTRNTQPAPSPPTRPQDVIPWPALEYVVGQINYGGRVTDDQDRRLLMAILRQYITPDVLDESYRCGTTCGTTSLSQMPSGPQCVHHARAVPLRAGGVGAGVSPEPSHAFVAAPVPVPLPDKRTQLNGFAVRCYLLLWCVRACVCTSVRATRFTPSGTYFSPPAEAGLEEVCDYVRGLPPTEAPEVFGMHANANISFQLQVRGGVGEGRRGWVGWGGERAEG